MAINHGQFFLRRVGSSVLIAGYVATEDELPDEKAVRATMIGDRITLDVSNPIDLEIPQGMRIDKVLTEEWRAKPPGFIEEEDKR